MDQSIVRIEPRLPRARAEPAAEVAEECRARANLYRLLAGAFAEEPTREYLEALREPQCLAALAEAGLDFDADFTAAELDGLESALACEYTTLLASPGGCPPIESARLTGRYQQEPYFAVKEAYRRSGFEVGKGRFAVFDDALGIELQFIAALLDRAAAALEQGDSGTYVRLDRDIKRFWTLHLGRWVRGYASLVARATQHSFYREMATLLRTFTDGEIALMGLRVEDLDGGKEAVPRSEVSVLVNPDEPVCGACELGGGR